ncbi:MAG: response regulator [Pseudomonadota bacterium]|nr:response regulator [Pseudomonadota bacterium]
MSLLRGKLILVVEDEPIVAMMIEDLLEELGARALGPARSNAQALHLAETSAIDAAILDVNLGDERSYEVAERLRERGVPFVFATGYGTAGCERFALVETVRKPFDGDQLAAALERSLSH